jgi:TM2 domain-containing membrane protein YozV
MSTPPGNPPNNEWNDDQPPGYPPYGQPPAGWAPYHDPNAPYGYHPATGIPYSDKSKIVAGLLQILLPLGIGRFYIGDTNIGIAQLLVTIFTCGIGGIWPFIDGIIILVTDKTDAQGRMLRS